MAAKIQPQWVEAMAPHLIKREHFEPHWSAKRQAVMAYEKVHLHGLTIIEKSLVQFANIDQDGAAEIFLREGLAVGEIRSNLTFLVANRKFLAILAKQEEKLSRPELFVGEREIFHFYLERIPQNIVSTRQLESWHKNLSKDEQNALLMTRQNILSDPADDDSKNFPDQTAISRNKMSISYEFKPGSERDGATITIPQAVLNQVNEKDLDWAVPGIIREKCILLLKGLPKSLRKLVIPISRTVDEVLPVMTSNDGPLLEALITQIRIKRGVKLTKEDFANVELPNHLRIKIRTTDEKGKEVGFADELEKIKKQYGGNANPLKESKETKPIHTIQQQGLKDWVIGTLPRQVEIGDELVLIRYPALVDNGDSVAIDLFPEQSKAEQTHIKGLVRLFMLRSVAQRNLLKKRFSQFLKLHALLMPPDLNDFTENAIFASYVSAFTLNSGFPTNKEEFEAALISGKANLYSAGETIASVLAEVLEKRFSILKSIHEIKEAELRYFVEDVEQQIDNLMTEKLFLDSSLVWFEHYPRYFKGIEIRVGKAPHLGPKDMESTNLIQAYWQKYLDLEQRRSLENSHLVEQFRWMLEEFRMSLFAQALGTSIPISTKRLEKQLNLIKA